MGQYWHILNMTRREISDEGGGKLHKFFFADLQNLYNNVRVCNLPKPFDTWLERGSVALQPGPFGMLSAEIIEMIMENLDTRESLVFFAITCKRLLAIGKPFLLRALRDFHSPWAFNRLICLGEYTQDKDLPQGLLTEEQRAEIEDSEEEMESLSMLAGKMYTEELSAHKHLVALWEGQSWRHRERKGAGRDAKRLLELDMIERLYWGFAPTYPREGVPVLCNVSKAEYVREDQLTEIKIERTQDVPDIYTGGSKTLRFSYEVGLQHALLSRICWTSDLGFSLACEEPYRSRLTNGPWAGDKFCITTLEEMPSAGCGKTWKDVTGEVDELLVYLWDQD